MIWKNRFTYKGAQHIRPVKDTERGLIEIIKYGSKIFTEPDIKNKSKAIKNNSGNAKIYAKALHTIFQNMKGHRLFDSFSFTLPHQDTPNESSFQVVANAQVWKHRLSIGD